MASKEIKMKLSLADVPAIRGLIEVLTEVAARGVRVVESWEKDLFEGKMGELTHDAVTDLKDKILDLNDYVDERLNDE